MSGKVALAVGLLALLSIVVLADDTLSADQMEKMSKENLISALKKTRTQFTGVETKLKNLEQHMEDGYDSGPSPSEEKKREANEKAKKDKIKKKQMKKRAVKLKNKEKLSDIIMDHGAKYLAFIAAKENTDNGSDKQQKAVLKAARKGGRAGAVGPLRKVAHSAAVAAVKKARAAAKKAGKNYSKHKMRRISLAAAKKAVHALLAEQDALVEKAVQKWAKAAVQKYPPAIQLARHHDKPNHFVAPPTIHLLMDDTTQMIQAPEAVAKAAADAKKAAAEVIPEVEGIEMP